MEIGTPVPPSAARSTSAPTARVAQSALPTQEVQAAAAQELQPKALGKSAPAPDGPRMVKLRAELRYDETINRVVGRVIDETTGREIREIPPEELRALYAKTREMLGPLVDEKA